MSTFRRTRTPAPESTEALRSLTRLRVQRTTDEAAARYRRVRAILMRYLSPILVDSVLDRTIQARRLTPAWLSPETLGEVTAHILVGLRLFVPAERLPELMVELAAELDTEAHEQ
jgi:hypothetical protein